MNKGFTLIEFLIYSAILVVVSTLLVSILSITTKIAGTENSSSEIANQGNFIIQTFQRLVRESSAVDVSPDFKTLSITSANPTTVVFDGISRVNLSDNNGTSALNTPKVKVTSLVFKKISNPGASDMVSIDLILSYNSANPDQALIRTFSTAVSRWGP